MVNTINNTNHVPVTTVSRNVSDTNQYQGNDSGGNFYRPMKKKKQESKEIRQKPNNNNNTQIDLIA